MYAEETLVIKAEVDEKRQRIADLELQASLPCLSSAVPARCRSPQLSVAAKSCCICPGKAPQAAPDPAADHASYMLQGRMACLACNPPGLGRPLFTVLPSVRRSRRSRWPMSTSCG